MRGCIYTVGRVLWILLLAPPVPGGVLGAQESVSLEAGTRIRVTAPALQEQLPHPSFWSEMWRGPYPTVEPRIGRARGTVLSTDADSLIFQLEQGKIRTALPWNGIELLERYVGGRAEAGLVGALLGAAVGAALGYAAGDNRPCTLGDVFDPFNGCGITARDKATIFGMFGGVVGGGIRTFVKEWVPVPLAALVSLRRDVGGSVELSASRRF